MEFVACIITAAATSLLCSKFTAAYTFTTIDRYVKDIIDLAKEEIKEAYKRETTK